MLKKSMLLGLVSLLLLAGLAACGDAPTNTPTPPTATAVPTPIEMLVPTPSLAPSPTANPAPSGITTATTPAAPPVVPAPPGATPITIDTSVLGLLLQSAGIPAGSTGALQINLYASNDDLDTFAANYSRTLQAASFTPLSIIPGLAGSTLLNKQGQQYLGLLSRNDTQAIVAIQPYTDDFIKQAASAGIPADILKTVTDQIAGKKTVAIAVSGTGLLQAFTSAFMSGGAQPTPSPTK